MKVDNFMLSMHQTCPSKYDLRIQHNWSPRRKSAALGFGAVVHEGLGCWYKNSHLTNVQRLEMSIEKMRNSWPAEHPVDDYRTLGKAIDVMQDYARTYPSESFKVLGADKGLPIVEQTFALHTGMFLSCYECGPQHRLNEDEEHECMMGVREALCPNCGVALEPIEYGGIFDTLVDFQGQIFILEHKTTSRMGSTYFLQFKPNNQVTGYVWGASGLSGRKVNGAIINAMGVYKSSPTKFERHITTRNAGDIEEWGLNVRNTCEEIQQHKRNGFFPMRTAACTLYGTCEFHGVHVLTTQIERAKRLENDFVKSEWNFERRDDDTVAPDA